MSNENSYEKELLYLIPDFIVQKTKMYQAPILRKALIVLGVRFSSLKGTPFFPLKLTCNSGLFKKEFLYNIQNLYIH